MKHDETADPDVARETQAGVDRASLNAAVRDRLNTFVSLLKRWNPTIRLVSNQDIGHLWARHIDDALQLIPLAPPRAHHAIDIGSGGGFPGLILAVVTNIHFDLIESDNRKAAFLQEAVTATGAPATVHMHRAEELPLKPQRLVTARALAPLQKLLELAAPFLADDGICLFPKGQNVDSEIADARLHWDMDLERIPSRTSPGGRILRITKLRRKESPFS